MLTWSAASSSVQPIRPSSTVVNPPRGKDVSPRQIEPCKQGPGTGTPGNDYLVDYAAGQILCGKAGADVIEVRKKGTKVWGGSGNDDVRIRNGQANEGQGGPGRDKARVDRAIDTWYENEAPRSWSSISSLGGTGSGLRALVEYPARQPRIQCRIVNGERLLLFDPPPEMRAVDATSHVDWQFVAWSPVLTIWNATAQRWEFVLQNRWLWDRTYDEQVASFPGNDWRRYDNNQEPYRSWFYALRPGYFRVAVYYYHYGVGSIPPNRIYDWVDEHAGEYAGDGGEWCEFDR